MPQYKCAKPCTISGEAYRVGDAIRNGAILPENVKKLIYAGYIEETTQDQFRYSVGARAANEAGITSSYEFPVKHDAEVIVPRSRKPAGKKVP